MKENEDRITLCFVHGDGPTMVAKKDGVIIVNVGGGQSDGETSTVTLDKTTVEPPSKYNVIMHNDDVTPMGFVVEVLVGIFKKDRQDAVKLMLQIHHEGKGVAGTYVKSIAEEKLRLTREVSEKAGYDEFKVTMERA